MPDVPDLSTSRWQTLQFRDLVAQQLRDLGVTSARRPDISGRLDAAIIEGTPFFIAVHRQQQMQLNATLDAAERAAREQMQPLFVTVHHRRGGTLRDSHVTMPLHRFAVVCREMGRQ